MKNFLKENWFKLMTGTSMLVFSFAFLLYVVSPTYANQTSENKTPKIEDEITGRWVLENNETTVKMNLETGEAYIMLRKYDDDARGSHGSRVIKSYDWEKIN